MHFILKLQEDKRKSHQYKPVFAAVKVDVLNNNKCLKQMNTKYRENFMLVVTNNILCTANPHYLLANMEKSEEKSPVKRGIKVSTDSESTFVYQKKLFKAAN